MEAMHLPCAIKLIQAGAQERTGGSDKVRLVQTLEITDKSTQKQLLRKITKGFDKKDSLLTDSQVRI
jgi:hypothetical protein